jgi:hypothetical protein
MRLISPMPTILPDAMTHQVHFRRAFCSNIGQPPRRSLVHKHKYGLLGAVLLILIDFLPVTLAGNTDIDASHALGTKAPPLNDVPGLRERVEAWSDRA